MIFNNAEENQDYLDSYGLVIGDEIIMINAGDFTGKTGEVVNVRPGFGGPLYNISFDDDSGSVKDNRFSRRSLELVEK